MSVFRKEQNQMHSMQGNHIAGVATPTSAAQQVEMWYGRIDANSATPPHSHDTEEGKCCNFENGDGGRPERNWAAWQLSNPAFSSNEVTSSASVSSTYPGCPHCGTDPRKTFAGISFVKCSCGKLACSSGIIGAENLCPWCGRVGALARHGTIPVLGMKDR